MNKKYQKGKIVYMYIYAWAGYMWKYIISLQYCKFLNEPEVLIIGIDYIICGETDIKFSLWFFNCCGLYEVKIKF